MECVKTRINIDDRQYKSWSLEHDLYTNVDPIYMKLFHGDVITRKDNNIVVVESIMRKKEHCGILVLDNNRTYGRDKKRLLYRLIPDNNRLPEFLVPYEIKMGFSKDFKNKYVTFNVREWTSKHPKATLTSVIGDVNDFGAFCDYRIRCRELSHSIAKMQKTIKKSSLSEKDALDNICDKYNFRDHTNKRVFAIDPEGCKDFDDAMCYEQLDNGWVVYVYIANVYVWMDELGLWDDMSMRVSTIYLPGRTQSMLPNALSEDLCSLKKGVRRATMTTEFKCIDGKITVSHYPSMVNVCRNYVYDEKALVTMRDYKGLYGVTQSLDKTVDDSHKLVAFWMMKTNEQCADVLCTNRCGIFRKASYVNKQKEVRPDLDPQIQRFLYNWKNVTGEYVSYENIGEHEALGIKQYAQVTSPIRRLVDTINQVYLMLIFSQHVSCKSQLVCSEWIKSIHIINDSSKNIRKVQRECELLYIHMTQPEKMDKDMDGFVVDSSYNNEKGAWINTVLLKEVGTPLLCKTDTQYEPGDKIVVRLYLFENESNLKKKIKVQSMII